MRLLHRGLPNVRAVVPGVALWVLDEVHILRHAEEKTSRCAWSANGTWPAVPFQFFKGILLFRKWRGLHEILVASPNNKQNVAAFLLNICKRGFSSTSPQKAHLQFFALGMVARAHIHPVVRKIFLAGTPCIAVHSTEAAAQVKLWDLVCQMALQVQPGRLGPKPLSCVAGLLSGTNRLKMD